MREVAAEFERPVLLFSGGKDSIVLLRLAEKAFRPAPFPFPIMHVDTGHNFPEVLEFRDRRVAELGRAADRRLGAGLDRRRPRDRGAAGRRATGCRPSRCSTRSRAPLRRGVRRRPPRRGARAGEGARALLPRRARPVGAAQPAPGAVEPVQRVVRRGESVRAFPISTGPSSTSGATSAPRSSRCRRSTSPTSARCSSATGCCSRSPSCVRRRRRGASSSAVRYRTVGDLTVTGAVRSDAADVDAVIAETAALAADRARRDARRRPHVLGRDGRPQARGLLLVPDAPAAARHRRLGRRRQVDADRPAAAGLQVAAGRPGRRRARSTSRTSPTACAPSASRASRSTSPTASSPPRGARSSSPTRPATSATRATWSPARRPPTSRWCWSTPASGWSSSRAATPTSPRCSASATWSRA